MTAFVATQPDGGQVVFFKPPGWLNLCRMLRLIM